MRLIIEAPNGRTYYGAEADAIYLKETMAEDETPKRCENSQYAAEVISEWFKNPDNIYCAFTLMNKHGAVYIFPPEILKRCIITVETQSDVIKQFIPESTAMKNIAIKDNRYVKAENLSGEHSSPGMGYEPEGEITEAEETQTDET